MHSVSVGLEEVMDNCEGLVKYIARDILTTCKDGCPTGLTVLIELHNVFFHLDRF